MESAVLSVLLHTRAVMYTRRLLVHGALVNRGKYVECVVNSDDLARHQMTSVGGRFDAVLGLEDCVWRSNRIRVGNKRRVRETPSDPDLDFITDRWLTLHQATRLRVMAILREDFDPDAY
jgi:hypothetical protein